MRFDHLASTHMTVGCGRIGKVEVDCRFVFTKSRWGIIGESEQPGGIIYLDLNFRQPPDCKLESATVTVILTEDDERGQHACPVKFTHHYGPKELRGRETPVHMRRVKKLAPEVQVLDYGGGRKKSCGPTIAGLLLAAFRQANGATGIELCSVTDRRENTLELQPTHSNLFHTAFALEHNAKKFYMMVRVSG
ncbi:hypothetical protein N657DRAFT_681733 [Parathielavia appendiculata]|uniref:Uncharacterized protein n=1 Tax=Parathielavia appendiculata TaxID=2587402 RepID=A0AAN6TZ08_9PEZI|nr:hypothetical protein N657DRAFT_681733 [Parathielavia appendiculata]